MSISTRNSSASSSRPSTRSSVLTRTSGPPKTTELTSPILKLSKLSPGAGNKKTSQAVQRKSYSLRNSRQNPEPTSTPREAVKEEKTLKENERKKKKAEKEDNFVLFLSDSSDDIPTKVVPNPQDEKENPSSSSADVEIVIVSSDDEKADSSFSLSSPPEVQVIEETSNVTDNVSKHSESTDCIEVTDEIVRKRPVETPAALEDSSPDASSTVGSGSSAVEIKPNEEVHETSSDSVNSETRVDSVVPPGKVKLFSPNPTDSDRFPEHQPSSSDTDDKTAESDYASGKITEGGNVSGKTEESGSVSLKPEPNSKECPVVESAKPSEISKEEKPDEWNEISDVNLASPTFSDRPVSSNSRSTTSTSSVVPQDHDIYSPGSTDLSMSEDSRGSFKESGSEKTVSTSWSMDPCSIGALSSSPCHLTSLTNKIGLLAFCELEDEQQFLLEARSGLERSGISTLCHHHRVMFLTQRYAGIQKKCCDPYQRHKRFIKKGLREISIVTMHKARKFLGFKLVAGRKLCPTCREHIHEAVSQAERYESQRDTATPKKRQKASDRAEEASPGPSECLNILPVLEEEREAASIPETSPSKEMETETELTNEKKSTISSSESTFFREAESWRDTAIAEINTSCDLTPIQTKSRGRVKSRLSPRVAHRSKRQSTQVSSSCSPSEDGSVEPPAKRSKRLPYRVGITWEIGHRLEAVDQNEWYPAKIVEVDKEACEILIHFEGWSARFDEWVPMDSPKLRPPSTPNPKAEAKDKQTAVPKFKPNEKILARWNDGKLYDATVTEVLSNGYYGVLFYDGFLKKLPVSAMRKLEKALKDKKMPLSFPSKSDVNKKSIFQRATKDQTSDSSSHSLSRPPSSTETTPPGSLATKQFIVDPDHNQFKCPVGGCSKAFRKENLLQSHIKHYHSLDKDGSDLSGRASPVSPRKGKARLKSLPTLPQQVFKEPSGNAEEETQDLSQKPSEFPDVKIESEGDGTSPEVSNVELELDKDNRVPKEGEPTTTTAAEDSSVPEQPDDKTTETPVHKTTIKPETPVIPKPEEKPVKAEPTIVVKAEPTVPSKVVKASPRKAVFPVTKMETRHAKPCLFRDDSIYTGYISYRSLYAKNSRGSRKNAEGETKKGKPSKNEEEKAGKPDGEPKRRRKRVFSKTEYGKKQKLDYSGIDEEIAEIKKRRVDRVSESSVKTDDTTKDSIDIDDDDEEETVSDQPEVYDDEVVRCICENEEENGLMFQCEDCKTWQHAACFNIENEEDVPDKYFCYLCTKPKGGPPTEDPPSANDLWLNNGVLATFSFLKDKSPAINRPNAILATHKLVDSTNKVLGILKCLQHKIQLAGSGSHLELKCWSKPWKQTMMGYTVAPQKLVTGGTHVAQTSNMPTQRTSDSDEFLVFDHAYFSHSDNVIDLQEEVVTGQPEDTENNLDISLAVSEVSSKKPVPVIQEPKEKILPRRRASTRESARGRGGRFREPPTPVEEVADIGTCKNNLVQHIHDVQNNVEHSLDVIESHLNLLEAEMGVSGSNENDLETALRSLKSLSKDLGVIQRFTFV